MNTGRKPGHVTISDKEKCCGCTACYAICPQAAIEMHEDAEGFRYPKVEKSKCIDCGLCTKVCPIQQGNLAPKTEAFFAAMHEQEAVREASSSGGVFSALAEQFAHQGGAIYGAAYDQTFRVHHVRTTGRDWEKLRTSKYVQSDMGDTFALVKKDLLSGRLVLFTGTPCQVDGLKKYLTGVDTSGLLTVDLICHGAPSPKVWQDYLRLVRTKQGKEIADVNFRNKKDCGWHGSTIRMESADGEIVLDQSKSENYYFKLFSGNLIIRPSCYACQYANLNRVGDITVGDYWGVEDFHPEMDDDKGLSLVMPNTQRGRAALKQISTCCKVIAVAAAECTQPRLQIPACRYQGREPFWWTYRNFGLEMAGKRACYLPAGLWDRFALLWIKVLDKARRLFKGQGNL